jgi:hypothetical protein
MPAEGGIEIVERSGDDDGDDDDDDDDGWKTVSPPADGAVRYRRRVQVVLAGVLGGYKRALLSSSISGGDI